MKITEPKTPYVRYNAELDEVEGGTYRLSPPGYVLRSRSRRRYPCDRPRTVIRSHTTPHLAIASRAFFSSASLVLHRKAAWALEQWQLKPQHELQPSSRRPAGRGPGRKQRRGTDVSRRCAQYLAILKSAEANLLNPIILAW